MIKIVPLERSYGQKKWSELGAERNLGKFSTGFHEFILPDRYFEGEKSWTKFYKLSTCKYLIFILIKKTQVLLLCVIF